MRKFVRFVIAVEKETWETEHKSDPDLCDGCFGFRPEELCVHRSSDHNFYAVCSVSVSIGWLLGGGGGGRQA